MRFSILIVSHWGLGPKEKARAEARKKARQKAKGEDPA